MKLSRNFRQRWLASPRSENILQPRAVRPIHAVIHWLACFLYLCTLTCGSLIANDSPLADAVERKDHAAVRQFLQTDSDVNSAQVDGMTALHWAVFYDDLGLTKRLVDVGADVAAKNRYGVSPLSIACENGNAEIAELLIVAGADSSSIHAGGVTDLLIASRTGNLQVVRVLLAHGADVAAEDHKQQTAIMWAAAEGHAAVVNELIRARADFKATLASGFSPLMFAVREGKTETVLALLQAGADVNEHMNPERTGGRHPRRGMSPIHLAIENGHYELAAKLLEFGANPNDQRCGFTPLHNISWVRKPPRGDDVGGAPAPIGSGNMTSLELVRVLVENGADINARLKKGQSGRGKMSHKGATPFLFAARRDDLQLMKLLFELGADPTIPNDDDCTALLVAAGVGTLAPGEEAGTEDEALEAVEWLLSLGADINHVDANGETAMHGAAYKSLPLMVQLLGKRGAKVQVWNQKNKYGWTPTLIAEGHRPGNFKPAAETLHAVHQQLIANGITPPEKTPPEKRKGYDQ